MSLDLNIVLASIDRRSNRFALSLSRKVYNYSMRGGYEDNESSLTDLFSANLLESMWRAHLLGLSAVRSVRAGKKPSKDQAEAMRAFYGSIARSASKKAMSQVRDKMLKSTEQLVQGKSNYEKPLKGIISKTAPQHIVNTINRTQTALAFNAATWVESYNDEDLWGYEYSTAGDERVRKAHEEMDGIRYAKNDPFWKQYAPPNGWNCRCALTAIYGKPKPKPYKGQPEVDKAFRWNAGALFTQGS